MAKARDEATGRFLQGPEPEWHTPLVWEKAETEAITTTRPAAYRVNPQMTKLVRKCQCCGQEFDALERVPNNYKLAEQTKYCSQTCVNRATKQRQRERERQRLADCLPPKTEACTGGGVAPCLPLNVPYARGLTRQDVE